MSKLIDEGATAKIYRDGIIAIKVYLNATVPEVKNEMKRQHVSLMFEGVVFDGNV